MKKKIYYTVVIIFLLSITMSQCKCSKGKPKVPDVDISKVDLTFYRFDRDFQQNDTFNTKTEMQALQKKYNSFYDVYIYKLMRFGEPNDSSDDIYTYINYYFMYRDMIQLYQMTQKAFPNTDANDEEIRRAFAYSKLYLPQLQLPKKVVYCISGLNAAAFTIDADYAGIGLDMYLNKDTLYNQIFPNYIAARLRKEMMCQNVMKAIYNYQYNDPYATSGALINNIIQVGKQQYYLEKVLPHIAEEYQFGYSQEQLSWCDKNEKEIWKYLADKDLFYTESEAEIRHFIGEQANTVGMPPESPGNIGAWIGYKIVSAYMDQMNNKPTIDQLIKTDAKTILAKSKYKP